MICCYLTRLIFLYSESSKTKILWIISSALELIFIDDKKLQMPNQQNNDKFG